MTALTLPVCDMRDACKVSYTGDEWRVEFRTRSLPSTAFSLQARPVSLLQHPWHPRYLHLSLYYDARNYVFQIRKAAQLESIDDQFRHYLYVSHRRLLYLLNCRIRTTRTENLATMLSLLTFAPTSTSLQISSRGCILSKTVRDQQEG